MVSSSERLRPERAALIGSMSPTMSAIVTSGVASFSTYRRSRDSHATAIASPSLATRARHDADLLIEQRHQRAQQPCLRLTAKPEQDEVVLREQRIDELGHDAVVVADDAGEERTAGAELANQVFANLLLYRAAGDLPAFNRLTQRAQRRDRRGSGHVPDPISSGLSALGSRLT